MYGGQHAWVSGSNVVQLSLAVAHDALVRTYPQVAKLIVEHVEHAFGIHALRRSEIDDPAAAQQIDAAVAGSQPERIVLIDAYGINDVAGQAIPRGIAVELAIDEAVQSTTIGTDPEDTAFVLLDGENKIV